MIQRAREALPGLNFAVLDAAGLTLPAGSSDCVLLLALLTCIADDASQRSVVDQLAQVIKSGGVVYLSDYLLQTDLRSVERYQRNVDQGENLRVFVTDDGARVRHPSAEWLDALFARFVATQLAPNPYRRRTDPASQFNPIDTKKINTM